MPNRLFVAETVSFRGAARRERGFVADRGGSSVRSRAGKELLDQRLALQHARWLLGASWPRLRCASHDPQDNHTKAERSFHIPARALIRKRKCLPANARVGSGFVVRIRRRCGLWRAPAIVVALVWGDVLVVGKFVLERR